MLHNIVHCGIRKRCVTDKKEALGICCLANLSIYQKSLTKSMMDCWSGFKPVKRGKKLQLQNCMRFVFQIEMIKTLFIIYITYKYIQLKMITIPVTQWWYAAISGYDIPSWQRCFLNHIFMKHMLTLCFWTWVGFFSNHLQTGGCAWNHHPIILSLQAAMGGGGGLGDKLILTYIWVLQEWCSILGKVSKWGRRGHFVHNIVQ